MVGWRVAIEMLSRLLTTRCLGSGCERLGRVGGWERRRRGSCGLLTRCEILILACNGINVQVRLLSLEHPELDGSRNAVSAFSTRIPCRGLSSAPTSAKLDSKAFSKTLLLPKTSFPLWSDPAKTEAPFRRKTCDELYRWQVCDTRTIC